MREPKLYFARMFLNPNLKIYTNNNKEFLN